MHRSEPKFVRQSSKDFPIKFSTELLSIIYTRSVVDTNKMLLERLLDGEIDLDGDLYALNSGDLFKKTATPNKTSESLIKEFVYVVLPLLTPKQRYLLCENLIKVEFDQLKGKAFRGASTSLAKIVLRAEIMRDASAELRGKMIELDNLQDGFALQGSLSSLRAGEFREHYKRISAELVAMLEDAFPETLKKQIKCTIIPGVNQHLIPKMLELSEKNGEKINIEFNLTNFIVFSCFGQNVNLDNFQSIYAQVEQFDEKKELALSDQIPNSAKEDRALLNKYLRGQKQCVLPFFAITSKVEKEEKKQAPLDEIEIEATHGMRQRPGCSQSSS